MLIDSYGRQHTNVRISVTDRCNIRCFYCMPEDVRFGPRDEVLSFEEIERLVRILAGLGRGQSPSHGRRAAGSKRPASMIERIARRVVFDEIALTTNGVLLAQQAKALYDADLRRLNVHLDTLDRATFEKITRRDEFDRVMAGIEEALRLGFKVKINAVALKGVTETMWFRWRGSAANEASRFGISNSCRWMRRGSGIAAASCSPTT